jgi:hypothetical protein
VATELAAAMPADTRHLLGDTPDLCGGYAVWLTLTPEAAFLAGRFSSANWDVKEILARKDDIVSKDLLRTEIATA